MKRYNCSKCGVGFEAQGGITSPLCNDCFREYVSYMHNDSISVEDKIDMSERFKK